LPSKDELAVGLPAINGETTDHILISGAMYKRIPAIDKALPEKQLHEYTGEYKMFPHKVLVDVADGILRVAVRGAPPQECSFVESDVFTCAHGSVSFVRNSRGVAGVKVGESFLYLREK